MAKPIRTCILALTHRGSGVSLIATKDNSERIRKGQLIEVRGHGVVKVTEVRTEDVTERGQELTLQWVSFNADGS